MTLRRRVIRLEATIDTGRIFWLMLAFVTRDHELLGFAHIHRNQEAEAEFTEWLADGRITRHDTFFMWFLHPEEIERIAGGKPLIPPSAACPRALDSLRPYFTPGLVLHYHGGMGEYRPDPEVIAEQVRRIEEIAARSEQPVGAPA